MKNHLSTLFRSVGLGVASMMLLAASCEQKKTGGVPEAGSQTNNATTSTSNETTSTNQALKPEDVGPKTDAIFMLSGLKGYTEPCGCTLDIMLGGIDRIAGYISQATPLYRSVTVVDGGDLLFETAKLEEHEVPQEKAKVDLILAGLKQVGVKTTVPGERDFALGADFYFEKMKGAGILPIAANLAFEGHSMDATLADGKRLYVGIVDPSVYDGIDGAKASEPKAALQKLEAEIAAADVTILLVHGDLPFAKEMLTAMPKADFALVGHGPRETDQVDTAGSGFTLEPYDQGRYLGVLKLYNTHNAAAASFADARPTSKAELEKVERQIAHVNESINRIPPASPGEEPEMLSSLRNRLDTLRARLTEIKNAAVKLPESGPAFLWRSIPLEPGYTPDPEIEKLRNAYNLELKRLNGQVTREIPAPEPGEAGFVGTEQCATCHGPEKDFWDKTAHGSAFSTLVERQKDFDQKCVGCHVVGYEQPGGSMVGMVDYDATIQFSGGAKEVHKDLRNVGCESCHGAGSLHVAAPTGTDGRAQHILASPTEEQCSQCHVPEHSPRFRFDVYVPQVTGPGHPRTQ